MNEQIQAEVTKAIKSVPCHWRETKTTKKALKQITELGLLEYLPKWMQSHGGKAAAAIAAVIDAATNAGGKVVGGSGFTLDGDGYDDRYTTEASALYTLLNPDPEEEEFDWIEWECLANCG